MPFSRSRSIESMTRSATSWLARNDAGLAQHGVDEGGLAVVDVGDDRDVAQRGEEDMGAPSRRKARANRAGRAGGGTDSTGRSPGGGLRPPGSADRRRLRAKTAVTGTPGRSPPATPGSTTMSSVPTSWSSNRRSVLLYASTTSTRYGTAPTRAAKAPGHARRVIHDATTAPNASPAPPPKAQSTGSATVRLPGPVDPRLQRGREDGEEEARDDGDRRAQPHRRSSVRTCGRIEGMTQTNGCLNAHLHPDGPVDRRGVGRHRP